MPLITNQSRVMGDGTKITMYTDSVGPAFVTYTMEKEQESFTIYNKGLQPIVYTVGATSNVTVNPGEKSTVSTNFTSFQVKSTSGVQQFLIETDEAGDEFEDVKVKKLSDRIGVLSSKTDDIVTFVNPSMTVDEINAVLSTKKHVRFQSGIYNIPVSKRVLPSSNQIIEFDEGAELKIETNNLNGYEILKIVNIDNLTIIGGVITGDRTTHTGTLGEHGHGLWIENTNNLTIRKMKVQNCWGDGFYHKSGYNTHFDRIQAENNRRNNITVISADGLTIDSPVIKKANGTAPEAGIDIEPNFDNEVAKRIVINNPHFEDNNGNDIGVYLFNKKTTEDTISIEINNATNKCTTLRQAALININYIYPNIKGKININNCYSNNSRFLSYSDIASTVAVNIKNPTIQDWANSSIGAMTLRNNNVLDTNFKLGNVTIDNPKFIINQYSGATTGIEIIDSRAIDVTTDPIYVNNPIVIGAYAANIKVLSPTLGTKFSNVFVNDSAQSRMYIDYSYVNQYTITANSQQKLLLPPDLVLSNVGRIEMLVEVVTMNTGGDSGEIALFTWNGTAWSMNEIIPLGKTSSGYPHQFILDTDVVPALKNKNASTAYTFLVKVTLSGLYGVTKSSTFYRSNSTLLTQRAKMLASTFSGLTVYRPSTPLSWQQYNDTTLNKPIWCKTPAVVNASGAVTTPAVWVDATGTVV